MRLDNKRFQFSIQFHWNGNAWTGLDWTKKVQHYVMTMTMEYYIQCLNVAPSQFICRLALIYEFSSIKTLTHDNCFHESTTFIVHQASLDDERER